MKKKLLNPRGYLSHTQIDMWLRDRNRYARNYFHGEVDRGNDYTDFGSKVAKAQEDGAETDDELVNMLVKLLPRYPKREHEIRATLKTSAGEVVLLGRMDQFHDVTYALRDTKTGKVPWTQAKANSSRQLKHYAALVYLKHGVLPPETWIDWAETKWEDDGDGGSRLTLTGRIESFHVKPTLPDILEYLALASRVAREIDAAYKTELKKMA